MRKINKRAERRRRLRLEKRRAIKVIKEWGANHLDPKIIGKTASVHGAACSCMMCGNPRKKLGEKTRQEIIQNIKDKENND